MFIPCIIRRIWREQRYALIFPLLYSTYWRVVYIYTTRPICISSNSGGSNKLPDDGRLCRNMWEPIYHPSDILRVSCFFSKLHSLSVEVSVQTFETLYEILIFIPCIIRRIRRDQRYALIFTTHLFYVLKGGIYTTRFICISNNSEGSNNVPDDGRLLSKHVGANT
jgi:hypothetical protein